MAKGKVHGTNEVIRNFKRWDRDKREQLQRFVRREIEPMLERYAKENRPWTDRTGAARRGLFASSYMTANELVILVAHTVYYGVYLELLQAGKYAILVRTIEANRADILRKLQRFWSEG